MKIIKKDRNNGQSIHTVLFTTGWTLLTKKSDVVLDHSFGQPPTSVSLWLGSDPGKTTPPLNSDRIVPNPDPRTGGLFYSVNDHDIYIQNNTVFDCWVKVVLVFYFV